MNNPHASAVLTGDFISSRKASSKALDAAMATLAQVTADLQSDTHTRAVFDRHRGDGWQIYLSEAAPALRAALRIVAALAAGHSGLASRIAIGFGPARLAADGDLAAATGAAFVTSGETLDGMDKFTRLSADRQCGAAFQAMIGLLDWQSRHWSAAQAEALYWQLASQSPTQEEIAEKLGVTRQAVQQRLAATGYKAILEAVRAFETHLPDLVKAD